MTAAASWSPGVQVQENLSGKIFSGPNLSGGGLDLALSASADRSVTALDGGGFVVTWSMGGDIRGQIFDATGQAIGVEFPVNAPTKLAKVIRM